MRSSYPLWLRLVLLILVILVVVILGNANYRFAVQEPGGNDFLTFWQGARYWLVEGGSPYDEEVALRNQELTFGRPADFEAGEDGLAFVYPLPAMLFFGPFGLLPFNLARAIWTTFLEIGLVMLAIMSIRIAGWKPSIPTFVLLILFSVFWYHGFRSVILGQITVLGALLIAGSLLAIKARSDPLAGVLLGLAIVKPQLIYLLIPFVLIWAIHRRRVKIVAWLLGTIAVLIVGTLLLMPDWPIQWLQRVFVYSQYAIPVSPISYLAGIVPRFTQQATLVISGLLLIYLFYEWAQSMGKGDRWFQWTAGMTLAISILLYFRSGTTNYLILFPSLCIVFGTIQYRWGKTGTLVIWLTLIFLMITLWLLFILTVEGYQEHSIMHVPFAFFIMIGMLWARWWNTSAPRISQV
jgi:hypothetical protein